MNPYKDILDTKWDGVRQHARQGADVRAAQFSPFAALTGYSEEIRETERLTEQKEILSDEVKQELDLKLAELREQVRAGGRPAVTVRYFIPDERKSGGRYEEYTGTLKKIDEVAEILIFSDEKIVKICEISRIL